MQPIEADVRRYLICNRFSVAILAIAPGLVPLAGSALAQDAPSTNPSVAAGSPHRLRDKFEAANTTHDGHLTLAQAQDGSMPMVARNFGAIDADHKGYVTFGDIRQFMQSRRAARQSQPSSASPTQ